MAEGTREKPRTWDEALARHSPEVQAAARALEAVIRDELQNVVVQFDPGNGLLAFGRSMKMRDLLFALIPHAGWVNLQLADGSLLPNPDGLIEGSGNRIRHVKVRSAEVARDLRVLAIVQSELRATQVPDGAGQNPQFGRAAGASDFSDSLRRAR